MSALVARSDPNAIRVLIVDDSAIVRTLTSRWIAAEGDIQAAGVAGNGREGVAMAGALKPDVVMLDVEMPELDGLAAIPEILRASPQSRILMASTLTRRNAEVTLKALSLGATDYIAKPETGGVSSSAADEFRRALLHKIRGLAPRRRPPETAASPRLRPPIAPARPAAPAEIVVIGASTGGPQALRTLVAGLEGRLRPPILIVQHMPPVFTAILAEHLSKASSAPAYEARDGMPIKPGAFYLAPGDQHMRVTRRHGAAVIALDQGPPVNYCRPAVDPLFESAAEAYGAGVLGLVLTGMGTDGREGAARIAAAGGAVIVQDEASSVVWGMPGAVAQAGLAAAAAPLTELPALLQRFAHGNSGPPLRPLSPGRPA